MGSVKFWELAKQGKLFGYAAGEKDPVQIQLVGNMPGSLQFSEPLSTDKEKLASRNAETGIESPCCLFTGIWISRMYLGRLGSTVSG